MTPPTKVLALAAGLLLLASPALPCHVIVHPGGPYVAECVANPVTLPLDGSQSSSCTPGPLFFVWSTDCPGATMDSATAVRPRMTLPGPPPCPIRCTVTLTILDSLGRRESATAPVTVDDTEAPLVAVSLAPLLPLAPRPAASVCSGPRSRTLSVGCAATDACDPMAIPLATTLVVSTCDPLSGAPREESVAVDCGETLRIEPDRRPCRRSARPPRPALSVDSTGLKVVRGLTVRLEGAAADACGNLGGASFDPTLDLPPGCLDRLPDGTCCPPLGR